MSIKSSAAKSTKPAPKPTSKGKPAPKPATTPAPEAKPEIKPEVMPTPPLTLDRLQDDLQSLRLLVIDHSLQIAQILEALARKRKPVISTDKVQIKDIHTGTLYPSKNGAYQSLLKSGALKELIEKGVFGPNPDKNTFGWYALVREWPDRFEEVKQQP
jgi:hypothetical protein